MTYAEELQKRLGYTPINATAAPGVSLEAHDEQVALQQEWLANNPDVLNTDIKAIHDQYADVYNQAGGGSYNSATGYYTNNSAQAQLAQSQGATATPTTYNGQEGWYQVSGTERAKQTGASGADEDLMSDGDYAIIQQLKAEYAAAQAAGDTESMAAAHAAAERIRAGYGYMGGTDGSQYLTTGELGVSKDSLINGYDTGSTGTLGTGSGDAVNGDLSDYLRQMYQAMTDAQIAELTAAYEKNLAELERSKEGLSASYQDARNQTAGASELAARNFNEYAAARGLNTGTGGQAELARNVTLQNNLNSLNAEEAQAYADLELARANAETEYNLAVAQAQASGDYELAAALYQEQVRVQELLAAQQEALLQQSSTQKSQLAAYGDSDLQSGIMPSAAMLQAMGITEADAQAYLNAMTATATVSNSGTSSSGTSSSGSGSTMSLTTAKQAASNGVFTDDVLSVLYANGYTDTMLKAIYGYGVDRTGDESILNLESNAVKTAKTYIDRGIWTGETLLQALEAAVGHTITEAEALAIMDYAGL